jgi:hypothetical protein
MVAAIRQRVTVQPGGVVEVRSAELRPGTSAEVIVLVESAPAIGEPQSGHDALRALDALQQSLALTPSQVTAWAKQTRQERRAGSLRRERTAKPPKRR